MKRTPFYPEHVAHGATMYEAQGWEMPAQYGEINAEQLAVRQNVGVTDFSSTGEIEIQGRDALTLVQRVIVNDAGRMPVHRVLYSTMCRPDGTILADVTIYRLGPERYMVMTAWGSNGANERVEYDWLCRHAEGLDACITDVSSGVALLALQGPRSRQVLAGLTDADLASLPYMWAVPARIAGIRGLVSRTGYTGELGYELLCPAEHAHDLWEALLSAGKPFGLTLCGHRAVFNLRLDKGYIARFDMSGATPYEVGLGWTVKLGKGDFVGRDALARQQAEGVARRLVSLQVAGEHIPAAGETLTYGGRAVGQVTSGGYSVVFRQPVGLGFVPSDLPVGAELEIQGADGLLHPARIAPRPMYDPEGVRLRS